MKWNLNKMKHAQSWRQWRGIFLAPIWLNVKKKPTTRRAYSGAKSWEYFVIGGRGRHD